MDVPIAGGEKVADVPHIFFWAIESLPFGWVLSLIWPFWVTVHWFVARGYRLEQIVEYTKYVETGHKTGNVVTTLEIADYLV